MARASSIADAQLLGALGARGGRASPVDLRHVTGLPARTLSRALGRLEAAGLLATRTKGTVTLSAAGWLELQPAATGGRGAVPRPSDANQARVAPGSYERATARESEDDEHAVDDELDHDADDDLEDDDLEDDDDYQPETHAVRRIGFWDALRGMGP